MSSLPAHWRLLGTQQDSESPLEAWSRLRSLPPASPYDPASIAPDAIAGLALARETLSRAISQDQGILLFGDYDADGITGVAILSHTLGALGARHLRLLPSRLDGYGLNPRAYSLASEHDCSLLITVDCGIRNASEISQGLTEHGVQTLVTDHHSCPPELPTDAIGILHPLLPQTSPEASELTGAGVALVLAEQLLLEHEALTPDLHTTLLALASIGTVGDIADMTGLNLSIVKTGLEALATTTDPSLMSLVDIAGLRGVPLGSDDIGYQLAPRLNATGRIGHPHVALRALLGDSSSFQKMEALHRQRRLLTTALTERALSSLPASPGPLLLLYDPECTPGVGGIIAGKVFEHTGLPTMMASPHPAGHLVASCRGPEDFSWVRALTTQEHLLMKYGGHTVAAGCSFLSENLTALRTGLEASALEQRGTAPPSPCLSIDLAVEASDLLALSQQALEFGPFGPRREPPTFLVRGLHLAYDPAFSHLDRGPLGRILTTDEDSLGFKLLQWSTDSLRSRLASQVSLSLHAVLRPQQNTFRGNTSLQFELLDWTES